MRDLDCLKNRLKRFLNSHPTGTKLIVINSHERMEAICGTIKGVFGILAGDIKILCFKSAIPEALKDIADKVRILRDYLTGEDCVEIDDYVFNDISKRWDSDAVKRSGDIFTYRGIELGRIAEYDLQLYLLIKVKALAVLTEAIKRGGYEAVFIIDANEELDGFDRLLREDFRISTDFVAVREKESPIFLAKRWTSLLISDILDKIAPLFIRKNKKAKLIDVRLFYKLGLDDNNGFIPAIFEKGLKIRFRLFSKARGYIALNTCLGSGKSFDSKVLADRFIYNNVPYWDVIEPGIKGLIERGFAKIRNNIDIFLNAAHAYNIRSVVLRNDLKELEKTVILAAEADKIPTMVVQHGILAEFNGHDRIYADKLATWGDYSIGWYKKFGNDPQKIVVTGNPEFEKMPNALAPLKKTEHLVTLISPGQSMFRQTAFVPDDVTEVLIKTTARAVRSIGGVRLIVKLHPNEDPNIFSKFIDPGERGFVSVVGKTNLHRLILESDAVITMDSTVGLEAVILGRPLIVMNFTGRGDLIPYVERKVAIGVYRRDGVEDAIRKVLYDEDAKRGIALAKDSFIKDLIYGRDGKSRDRILRLIEDL